MTLRGTFLGASLTSLNVSVGWGSQPSEMKVGLVIDPSNGDGFNPDNIGDPVYLQYGSLNFGGLLSNITYSNGSDGRVYEATVVDPRSILEGVQLIIAGYTGSVFNVPNLYNIYGALEAVYGDSGLNDSGIEWYKIRDTFLTLHFSNPIRFGNYSYYIDLSRLPSLPNYYRIGGEVISLMDFILEVCDASAHDVFFKLLLSSTGQHVITAFTVNRGTQPQFGKITTFLANQNEIVRSDIGVELRNETTSKFLVGGNKTDVLFQFADGGSTGDFTDNTIFPYWGLDEEGDVVLGSGNVRDSHNFILPSRGINVIGVGETYHSNIEEMRAALVGRDSWELLLEAENNNTNSIHFGKANKIGLLTDLWVNKILWDRYDVEHIESMTPVEMTKFLGLNIKRTSDSLKSEHEENIDRLYNYIKSFADEYYGVKYMVIVPSGQAKWDYDQNKIITNLEPTEGGFIEEVFWSGAVSLNLMPPDYNFVSLEDNRIRCYAKFDNYKTLDLSELSPEDYILGNHLGPSGSASVFVKATLQPEFQFLDRSEAYSPRAILELPGRVKLNLVDDRKLDVGLFKKVFIDKVVEAKGITRAAGLALFNSLVSRFGSELAFLGVEGLAVTPAMVAVPLKSNTDFYGPWYAVGANGKTEFEKDDSLVPWNYGGYTLMNLAGNAKVSSALANFQLGEGGSIELPGLPIIDIGAELVNSGPYITDINVSIGTQGVTTTYRMSTWSSRFGKIPKSFIDTVQKLKLNQNRDRRILRELNKLPPPTDKAYKTREFYRFDTVRRKKSGTSSSIIAGEIIDASGDIKRSNVVIGPAYNIVNHIDETVYDGKVINSLDVIFRPFTTDPTNTTLPNLEDPTHSGINSTLLNPYTRDSDFIIYNASFPADDELLTEASGYMRGIALRGPIIVTGWGYDFNDNIVPSGIDDYRKRSDIWKTGPLDLRWDDLLKIWCGGNFLQRGVTQETISYQGSGLVLDADTNEIDMAYDYLLSSTQTIATNKNVIYVTIHGKRYILGAQCS